MMHNARTMTTLGVSLLGMALTAAMMIGCGGGGPAASSLTGGGSGGTGSSGGSSFAVSASMTMNGGGIPILDGLEQIPAGTDNITLADSHGNTRTFSGVLAPVDLSSRGQFVILRKGSLIVKGAYSGTTATYVGQNATGTFPLNADGTLAQDTAIAHGDIVILPVTAIGALTFQNGVTCTFNELISDNSKDITLVVQTSSASVPSGGAQNSFSGQISQAPQANLPSCSYLLAASNSAAQGTPNYSTLAVGGGLNGIGSNSASFTNTITGSALPYTTTAIDITVGN